LIKTGYDDNNSKAFLPPFSQQAQHFSEIFEGILESQIKDQQIRFAEGSEDLMKGRMQALADKAFSVYVGVYGAPSSSNSSSIRSRPQDSLLGGSFENMSTPRTTDGQHSMSTSRSTAAHSRSYSMENQVSPHGSQMMTDPRIHSTSMGSPFMPRMVQQNFVPAPMNAGMQNNHPSHTRYPAVMETGIPSFAQCRFDTIDLNAGGEPWYGFNIDHPEANFDATNDAGSMNNSEFANLPTAPLAQTLVGSPDDGAHNLAGLGDWQQYSDATSMHYDARQQ
jgi:hypothetical protein